MINDAREIAMTACASDDYDKGALIGYIASRHPTIFARAIVAQRDSVDKQIIDLLNKQTLEGAIYDFQKYTNDSREIAKNEVCRVAEMIGYDTRHIK